MIGNHGIESPLTSRSTLTEAERICADWKRELESTLAPMILLGAEIEDKRYSLDGPCAPCSRPRRRQ